MNTKLNRLIRRITLSMIAVAILFTINTAKAEAIYCSNCANWVTQLIEKAETVIQTPLQVATKLSTGLLQYKEFTLDVIVSKLRDQLVQQVQKSTIKWIQSGYKGKPTFLTNPEGMVQDLVANQMYIVTNDIQKALGEGTRDLQLMLLKEARTMNDQSQAFQNSIKPTIGNTIKNSCCSAAGLKAVQQANNYSDAELANFRTSVCSIDGSTNEGAEKFKTVFANNFSCGGFDALAAMVNNPTANTGFGQTQATLSYLNSTIEKNKDQLKTNVIAGQGYLPNTTCTKKAVDSKGKILIDSSGKEICADGGTKILDPAQTAKAANDTALKSGVNTLTNAHEFSDIVSSALSAIGNAFIADITQRATSLVTGGINNGVNSLTSFINNQGNALNSSINSAFTVTPGSPSTGQQPSTSTGSGVNDNLSTLVPIPISAADNAALLGPLIVQVRSALQTHEKYISAVNVEKQELTKQASAVTTLDQCYASLPSNLKQTGTVISGQSYTKSRLEFLGGKIIGINIVLDELADSKTQANQLMAAMNSNLDLNKATAYTQQVVTLISGSLLKNDSNINQYQSDAQTNIDSLNLENSDVISPRQADCTCMASSGLECSGGSPIGQGAAGGN